MLIEKYEPDSSLLVLTWEKTDVIPAPVNVICTYWNSIGRKIIFFSCFLHPQITSDLVDQQWEFKFTQAENRTRPGSPTRFKMYLAFKILEEERLMKTTLADLWILPLPENYAAKIIQIGGYLKELTETASLLKLVHGKK